MAKLDLAPLYPHSVGFEYFNEIFKALSSDRESSENGNYPPYNIEILEENLYQITMAVAGFKQDDIDIEKIGNTLMIKGVFHDEKPRRYLHKGLAFRSFKRRFELADTISVVEANMQEGLLQIVLQREIPEALKPQNIAINKN